MSESPLAIQESSQVKLQENMHPTKFSNYLDTLEDEKVMALDLDKLSVRNLWILVDHCFRKKFARIKSMEKVEECSYLVLGYLKYAQNKKKLDSDTAVETPQKAEDNAFVEKTNLAGSQTSISPASFETEKNVSSPEEIGDLPQLTASFKYMEIDQFENSIKNLSLEQLRKLRFAELPLIQLRKVVDDLFRRKSELLAQLEQWDKLLYLVLIFEDTARGKENNGESAINGQYSSDEHYQLARFKLLCKYPNYFEIVQEETGATQ